MKPNPTPTHSPTETVSDCCGARIDMKHRVYVGDGWEYCSKCKKLIKYLTKEEVEKWGKTSTEPRETGRNDWNDVEIFLRLYGRLPHSEDREKLDYKKYCDMVMQGKKCPRCKLYDIDGLWEYAWGMYKKTTKETT